MVVFGPSAGAGARHCERESLVLPANVKRSDQLLRGKAAGGWLSLWLSPLDAVSKNVVGRTRFELVTSSVSGKSRAVLGVCHGRTESNGEPLTWAGILNGSR